MNISPDKGLAGSDERIAPMGKELGAANNEQFPALTGIRAIAAFMVFFNHLPLHLQPGFFMGLQLSFYTGVTLFFVLSGFLITWHYYEKVRLSGRWFLTYFVRRFARIYPVYFLVLTVVILVTKDFRPIFLLQNYTLTHNLFYLFRSHGMAIGPSWSLTVEECFYLAAPFIFLLARKYNFGLPFLLTLGLLILLLLTYGEDRSFLHSQLPIFWDSFFGHFLEFYIGIYLALLLRRKAAKPPVHDAGELPVAAGSKKWTLLGITGLILLFLPLVWATGKSNDIRYPVMVLINNFLLPFPIAMLYYGLISENSLLRKWLSSRPMNLLGRSSYAFYLLHLPLIYYLGKPHIQKYFSGRYNLYVLVILVVTILVSIMIFLFYEQPLNRLIRRRLARVTGPGA
ncbi:MAG TPA: acyltransferase [Puia sp.]|nr:acyltransferase [Puia sp.]